MGTHLMGNPERQPGRLRRAVRFARELLSDHLEGWKERRALLRSMDERSAHHSTAADPPSKHAVRNLSILLSHDEPHIRSKAARTLNSLCVRGYRIEKAIPALLETMEDDSVWVRMDAATALLAASTRSSFPGIYKILEGINRLEHSPFLAQEMVEKPGSARWTMEAMLSVLETVQDATTISSIGRSRLESMLKSMDGEPPEFLTYDE